MFPPWTDNKTSSSAVSSVILLCASLVAIPGCQQWMSNQPRVGTLKESEYFEDSSSARPQIKGTIARGQNVEETPIETGKQDGKPIARIPIEVNEQLLATGREQFHIYCHHCHGMSGYGDGMVVQRGFPQPPSYHIPRLRDVEDGHLFDVITNGIARMPHFEGRIDPRKRWAIVAYVRALQMSQYAPQADLGADDVKSLTEQDSGKD